MKQKSKTTGTLNKAERFVLNLIINENVHPVPANLEPAVRKHLGIWSEYQDELSNMPSIPPEYTNAIETAYRIYKDMNNYMV